MWKKSLLCVTLLTLCILIFVAAKTDDRKGAKLAQPKPVKAAEKSDSSKKSADKKNKNKKAKKAKEEPQQEEKDDRSEEERKDDEEHREGDDEHHGLLGNPDDEHDDRRDGEEENHRDDESDRRDDRDREGGDEKRDTGEDTFTADDPQPKITPEGDELPVGDNAENDSLMREWEEHMSDFRPRDMITFELVGGDEMTFYDEVGQLPSRIRGAYFVTSNEKSDIDFTITGPHGELIHENPAKHEGLFDYHPKVTGTFMFTFANTKYFETKMITFALNVANSSHTPHAPIHRTKITNASHIEEKLQKMQNELNNLHVETKFSYKRQESHLETSRQTHSRVLLLGIAESLGILLTACWQIYYIKKLLDNKRII